MNSRVSWSVDGIDPSVRERAEAAARRAGMSLSEWLNSTVGEPVGTPARDSQARDSQVRDSQARDSHDQNPPMPSRESRDVADIHQRLDSITQQIEQFSKPTPRSDAPRGEAMRAEPTVARQLNDAISRLDARLSQISNAGARQAPPPVPQPAREVQTAMVDRAAAQVYRPSPPLSPVSFDAAIAEIAARQNELDGSPQQLPPRHAPPMAPVQAAGPDFSSLERHLLNITSQIESLRPSDHIETSIAAFRGELAEIRQAITEAMPRRAMDSIENEIRSLSRRIDDSRQSGTDGQMLLGIERALAEIHGALSKLTPAEQLTGYDDAIRNLGAKLDLIVRSNDDPSTVRQLEDAISALRSIVSNVASNDALARLSEDVHSLSAKVEQFARTDGKGDSFAILEQRLASLTSTIETRERAPAGEPSEFVESALRSLSERLDRIPVGNDNASAFTHLEQRIASLASSIEGRERAPAGEPSEFVEGALRSLSERLDRIPVGNDNASAFAHLEQRVSYLLERLEASTDRRAAPSVDLGRVEEGLLDIQRSLERQHANLVSLADTGRGSSSAPAMDSGIVDAVKSELSDIRYSQSETDRRTQDSLETVHNTLGHVVDRLAMIEGDLRAVRTAPVTVQPSPAPATVTMREETPRAAIPSSAPMAYAPAPQPKPELPNPAAQQETFAAAPREFHAAQPLTPPVPPRAISEILEPHATPARAAIAPDLPPDHPLEPGTRPAARMSSPSERIAASESVINEIAPGPKEPVSSSSFIAAARRAAQAAAAAPANEKAAKAAAKAAKDKGGNKVKAEAKIARPGDATPSKMTSRIRSLLVGASVVVIVLGTFKMAMTLLDTGTTPPAENSTEQAAPPAASSMPPESNAKPAMPAPAAPSLMSPTPADRQSNNSAAPNTLDSARVAIPPQAQPAPGPAASATPALSADVTGAIPTVQGSSSGKLAMVQVPPTERLPDAIGGPLLRAAALKGDPTAAYEIGVRFAEGKAIAPNLDEAAKWYDRAAQAGVVPAVFRLGTFYEKGLSVKKDVDIARRYYLQAAERGNAKAMHNLAVLDADGGGKGANYKSASQWFRKAADRGVADSQFNLGILYARGIGVEQNLAESFKWFSLAAAQGDADSGRKRDDIAKRLDAQSLAAAKLAIQTFTPEPQPDDAINVAAPQGGWDSAPAAAAAAAKPTAKPVATKRAAAAAATPR